MFPGATRHRRNPTVLDMALTVPDMALTVLDTPETVLHTNETVLQMTAVMKDVQTFADGRSRGLTLPARRPTEVPPLRARAADGARLV